MLLSILIVIHLAIIIVMTVHHYRDAERHTLLWCLTVAAERGMPLDAVASAFAIERSGKVADRARHLAEYLEGGIPLSLALKRSGIALPSDALLAADMGEHTGNLGVGLRQVTEQIDVFDSTLRAVLDKLFYLSVLLLTALAIWTFLVLSILPIYYMMFQEFELEMPEVTVALMAVSGSPLTSGLAALFYIFLAGCMLLGLLQYVGVPLRGLPGIRLLWWPADCATVMRWLAIAVRRGRPLQETVRLLASYFPQYAMRRRLERAALQIERGAHWCESLERGRLIRRPESIVFRAAERAENLDWALNEMAESSMRRSAHRMNVSLNVVFPLVIVVLGIMFLAVALGVLLPLVDLIGNLA